MHVSFQNDTIAKIDRLREGVHGGPATKRAAWVAWATARFIAGCHACMEISASGHVNGHAHTCGLSAAAPAIRKIVRRPAPKDGATVHVEHPAMIMAREALAVAHEGARLKAARGAAGVTQAELAKFASTESVEVHANVVADRLGAAQRR